MKATPRKNTIKNADRKPKAAKKTDAVMATVVDQKGKSAGDVSLPAHMFGAGWNADLVHQVVEGSRANARQGNASTKGRGDVRGGGKKHWKQKGNGRARHGSSRSPIWVGGGAAHGPKSEKNYKVTLTASMKGRALASLLSRKLKEGKILFVDAVTLKDGKTAEADKVMQALATVKGFEKLVGAKKKVVFLANATGDAKIAPAFRNLASVTVGSVRLMNILDVTNHAHIVFVGAKEAAEALAKKA